MLSPTALASRFAAQTGLRRAIAVFLAGAATVLGLYPTDLWPIAFLTFPILLIGLDGARSRKGAFVLGWAFAFGYFTVGWYWISNALLVFSDKFWWMIPFALVGLPSVMAIYYGLASVLWFELVRRFTAGPVARILLLAAGFAAADMVRGTALTGFPWNSFGYLWVAPSALTQGAAVIGVYGLGVFVLLSALLPALITSPPTKLRRGLILFGLALPALFYLGGMVRLADAPDRAAVQADESRPGLRMVQADIPQTEKWQRSLLLRNFGWHLEDSARFRPDWIKAVIWPETAAAFTIEDREDLRVAAGALAAPKGGYLLTGAPRRPARGVIHNSLVALDDAGQVRATYDKSHLVPFGEYVPFGDMMPFGKVTVGALDYTPGPGRQTISLPGLPPFSPLICYESIFPGEVADPKHRPDWLLNPTNDAWYGRSAGPYQHLQHARLRAIEEGLPLVRPANTGISIAFDGYGREIGRIPLMTRGVLDFRLPAPLPETPYGRFGNWIPVLLVFGLTGIAMVVIKG